MLATGAGRTVGIDTDIGRIDVDMDGIVHFRIDEQTAKGCVSSIGGIERRFANQPVDTCFRTQITVGIIAFDLDRCGLDTGDFTVGLFQNGG